MRSACCDPQHATSGPIDRRVARESMKEPFCTDGTYAAASQGRLIVLVRNSVRSGYDCGSLDADLVEIEGSIPLIPVPYLAPFPLRLGWIMSDLLPSSQIWPSNDIRDGHYHI